MKVNSYERALKRMIRISVAVGAVGAIAVLVARGPRIAAGFLLGAALSWLNLRWWTIVANAIGGTGKAPPRGSAAILALRYLLFGGVIYGIVKILKITPVAVLAGLLVSVAAVMIEILYELIYARA
jgi:hypothetical protein